MLHATAKNVSEAQDEERLFLYVPSLGLISLLFMFEDFSRHLELSK